MSHDYVAWRNRDVYVRYINKKKLKQKIGFDLSVFVIIFN